MKKNEGATKSTLVKRLLNAVMVCCNELLEFEIITFE